ncbi:hypothetical protein QMK17_05360 [Rhodococcus sp. G-MC3]|uniref:DUF6885 family protein n=1 Tax=Rhodococcus sp. G-MC3 TaxID=3046209 RepID=UPI0024BBA9A3|nr:hypothetical protein [Rhodococcus sp. G-MC3]MDJ0392754.1 hypothetical protein [Rhodococcus sp. G-MC3]
MREFLGAAAVLAAQAALLPQPDQLCGPFSAAVALAGVLDDAILSVAELAAASGTRVYPHEVPHSRPPGVPVTHSGGEALAQTDRPECAGTTAAGLRKGIERATAGRVVVVPAQSPSSTVIRLLLRDLLDSRLRFAVLAHVHTAPITELDWNVGHFVTMWGFDETSDTVAVADTYRELGTPDMPPGCRMVAVDALAVAMDARGLLILSHASNTSALIDLVHSIGVTSQIWSV